jgi:hypothetical protein
VPDRPPTTRVLLFGIPRLLGDLVHDAFDDQPDLRLVEEPGDAGPLAAAIDSHEPDLVILRGTGDDLPVAARNLFETRPRLTVLALTGVGERAFLWQLVPHHEGLGGVSRARLLEAARNRPEWSWTA